MNYMRQLNRLMWLMAALGAHVAARAATVTGTLEIKPDGKIAVTNSNFDVKVRQEDGGKILVGAEVPKLPNGRPDTDISYVFSLKNGVKIRGDGNNWLISPDGSPGHSLVISRSADAWGADAQLEIAFCYWEFYPVDGSATPVEKHRDVNEAYKWVRLAASCGDAKAQYFLGRCYEFGWGVEKDLSKSAQWYLSSAEQGYEAGQYGIGCAYLYGAGVPKDEVEAYAYLNLAGMNNERIRGFIANLESRMSPEARLMGQQRARQIKQKIENMRESSEEAIRLAKKRLGA